MNKRKCKVFMFPTNANVSRILYSKTTNTLEYNPFLKINTSDKYQHIYILSNEKIENGDWYLSQDGKDVKISQCQGKEIPFLSKKIIATTDISLRLPQPPQEFIEAYIKVYNEGNPITEVMIEYEIICGRCYSNTDECWSAKECSRNTDFPDIVKLKVNSDNTINIKLIKDKWSREEVEQLCKLAFKYHCDNSRTTSLPDKWIEENI